MRNELDIAREIAELEIELSRAEGMRTEVYSRIVGYYRSVRNWNKGKLAEYYQRKTYAAMELIESDPENAKRTEVKSDFVGEEKGSYERGDVGTWLLFARATCPNCPPVKEYMKSVETTGAIIDVDTEEGLELARRYEVMKAPTVLFLDRTSNELYRAHTVRELEEFTLKAEARA